MIPQHFLVPIDFSAYADAALEYAITLASKLQARLTLLHVIQSLPLGGTDMGVALPVAYLQDLEAELRESMAGYVKRATDAGLQAEASLVHGVAFQEIVDLAKAQQVDLIIMGTHGRTGLRHVLLGSVAEKVVRLAPCPVLVTRQPASVTTP